MLVDRQIRDLAVNGMITPFLEQHREQHLGSFGLSSCGYDVRLGSKFAYLKKGDILEVGADQSELWGRIECETFLLLPHGSVLGVTLERISMPQDVVGLVTGKSSLARLGLLVNATPLEPNWQGFVTIELANLNPSNAIKLVAGMGIAQVMFYRLDQIPEHLYRGVYQNQPSDVVLSRTTHQG